jgi:PhoH-like ATPase
LKQRSLSDPGSGTTAASSAEPAAAAAPAAPAARAETARSRREARMPNVSRRLFVLDTNVLMHDPTAIFRFEEHDVYLPMVVLEELDAHKKGMSEASRNVRQVSRFLDDMMRDATKEEIDRGLKLPSGYSGNHGKKPSSGRLFFQTRQLSSALPQSLPGQGNDNAILAQTLALQHEQTDARVILVSKDINLRIKAAVLGVHAEDYYSDKTLEDSDVLYSGMTALPADFWERHGQGMRSWKEGERTFYEVSGPAVREWQPNQGLYEDSAEGIEGIVRRLNAQTAVIELMRDHRNERHNVWGITARNREQNFALNLLMDPEVDFVTVLGPAGTGKTLLALAAGLMQTLESNRFAEIIMTRVTIPLGEDIGFLPGTEEEKMEPWMGALMDNLEVLTGGQEGGNWGRAATNDLLRNRIKIRSLNFMRGRTFLNRFLILDEAQNLTPKQMKALITRAGPGTKVACLGNVAQIDTPYLTETTSGLTYAVNRFRGWPHSGHITLVRGERSRLADFASDCL